MKLRERYRKNRRDEVRRNQYIKAQERLRKKVGAQNISYFSNYPGFLFHCLTLEFIEILRTYLGGRRGN